MTARASTFARLVGRSPALGALLGIVALTSFEAAPLLAQAPPTPCCARAVPLPTAVQNRVAEVPFGPGEMARYQVKLGAFSVGDGVMQVVGVEPIRGFPSYHVSWVIQGGIPLARVDDHYQSWFDVSTLATRRSIQQIREVRYRAHRRYEIYPEERRWERLDEEEEEEMITDLPLDDISFIYYVRTLPLEVGETYTLDRYFRADRNPVVVQVLRRETIEVPAGRFNTIVVRPIIKSRGLFGEGGEAEVYFTDDERRMLVRLQSKVPVVGSLSLHLREYQAGTPFGR